MLKETFIAFLTRRGQLKFLRKKKCLKVRQRLGTREKFEILKFKIAQVDPRDMLNNFCFHVYAEKSNSHTLTLSHSLTLSLSHSHTLSFSHSLSLDMLNNFCFHV